MQEQNDVSFPDADIAKTNQSVHQLVDQLKTATSELGRSKERLSQTERSTRKEIESLTEQLCRSLAAKKVFENNTEESEIEDDYISEWKLDTRDHPTPPGDLNSPLIRCLLDHWTTDQAELIHLTDWIHHAIRGTGKARRPLKLDRLSSEISAGFIQLLVPLLRKNHGINIEIFARHRKEIRTDLILKSLSPTEAEFLYA